MYEQTKRENEKLKGLKGQMQDMSQDFDDMIKAREEAKRRLEARFQDVYEWAELLHLAKSRRIRTTPLTRAAK